MLSVIVAVAVGCLIIGLGVAVGPIRRWAVAEVRGYVALLALLNLLLASAIVWTVILFWP
jgi:hypothetical protein